nr:MAG TPA: hypothetical protein [Caudoviricetes sp.]
MYLQARNISQEKNLRFVQYIHVHTCMFLLIYRYESRGGMTC